MSQEKEKLTASDWEALLNALCKKFNANRVKESVDFDPMGWDIPFFVVELKNLFKGLRKEKIIQAYYNMFFKDSCSSPPAEIYCRVYIDTKSQLNKFIWIFENIDF